MKIAYSFALLALLVCGWCHSALASQSFSVSGRSTFLSNSSGFNPVGIGLEALGAYPGRELVLDVSGTYRPGSRLGPQTFMIGVFSESGTVLNSESLHRIPGAVRTDETWSTPDSNIPEDFLIANSNSSQFRTRIEIPDHATNLFVGVQDNFENYGDNQGTMNLNVGLIKPTINLVWNEQAPFSLVPILSEGGIYQDVFGGKDIVVGYKDEPNFDKPAPVVQQPTDLNDESFLAYQQQVQGLVRAGLSASGLADEIDVVVGPTNPDYVNVYFTDPLDVSGGQAGGWAEVDRFNQKVGGVVLVQTIGLSSDGDVPDRALQDADTVLHEAGHTWGLEHIAPEGANAIMDYVDPSVSVNPYFANPTEIVEYHGFTSDSFSPSGDGKHNPLYHIQKHVLKYPDERITITPGIYDIKSEADSLSGFSQLTAAPDERVVTFNFELSASAESAGISVEELIISEIDGSGFTVAGSHEFTDLSLSDLPQTLGELEFALAADSRFTVIGRSSDGDKPSVFDIGIRLDDDGIQVGALMLTQLGTHTGQLLYQDPSSNLVQLGTVHVTVSEVPEPASLCVFGIGSLCLWRRR